MARSCAHDPLRPTAQPRGSVGPRTGRVVSGPPPRRPPASRRSAPGFHADKSLSGASLRKRTPRADSFDLRTGTEHDLPRDRAGIRRKPRARGDPHRGQRDRLLGLPGLPSGVPERVFARRPTGDEAGGFRRSLDPGGRSSSALLQGADRADRRPPGGPLGAYVELLCRRGPSVRPLRRMPTPGPRVPGGGFGRPAPRAGPYDQALGAGVSVEVQNAHRRALMSIVD